MSHVPMHSRHDGVSFNPLPNEPVGSPHTYGQSYTMKEQDMSDPTNCTTEYPVHRRPPEDLNLKRPSYKPSALRWPFLSLLLLFIIAGMGLMGYALQKLPVEDSNVLDLHMDRLKRLGRRTPQTPSQTPSTTSSVEIHGTSTRLPDDFGDVGVTVTITSSTSTTPYPTPTRPDSSFADIDTTVSITVVGTVPSSNHGDVGTVFITESTPVTPTYVTAVVTTLIDSQGIPTYTETRTPPAFSTEHTTVLTNSLGQPTATQVTSVLATPVVTIQTDSNGIPTATITAYPVIPTQTQAAVVRAIYISYGQYFVGFFLPTVLSILLAIPIRILDRNAKLFQPWHELTHAHGATGRESLCRQTDGWQSVVMSLRSLLGGQVLVFLTTTLLVCSAVLVPLSAEAVTFRLYGSSGMSCTAGSMSGRGCAFVLSVFSLPARAVVGLLAFMAINILLVAGVLVRWQTGVATNPWSIAGTAGLTHSRELRQLFASVPSYDGDPERVLKATLAERTFKLGWFSNDRGAAEYGIMLCKEHNSAIRTADETKYGGTHGNVERGRANPRLPFFMLGYVGRLMFLFVLCGTLAVILYYNSTGGDTPFENFMDSESFGVRFLFTGVGVLITFFWTSFFTSLANLSPYLLLATEPQPARRSILLSPPTNAFSGVLTGLRRRHWFLATTAAAAVLSELLTVFLSNVPFRVTQTWLAARVCTWAAIGLLGLMTVVVLASFFYIRWPSHRAGAVPVVDPSTIAGAVYYVADSWMLAGFEGIGALERSERDRRVENLGERYEFGEITGMGGALRVAVDSVDGRVGGVRGL